MIRITSKKDGFRRCGLAHSKQPVEYADNRFTKNELGILQAESMLTVEVIADEGKAKGKKAEGKSGQAAAETAAADLPDGDK